MFMVMMALFVFFLTCVLLYDLQIIAKLPVISRKYSIFPMGHLSVIDSQKDSNNINMLLPGIILVQFKCNLLSLWYHLLHTYHMQFC